jgi:putative peptidoglycan lipid II flippase
VTGPAVQVTQDGPDPSAPQPAGTGIGRAAALIAGLTVLARLLGLVRTLVFAHTVQASCLGTAYVTANELPNIVYDVVLGGALTSIMVPVLARPAQRAAGDLDAAAEVNQTSSALLTWTILILAPVSALIAVAAGPISRLLNPHNGAVQVLCAHSALVTTTGQMLAVFAPQVLLYGLAVVLYGILQAHRRFAAPALAPVISSVVVVGAYIAFSPLGGAHRNLRGLPLSAELVLSIGTTAGVAALMLTALIPALRLRLRLRPTLRFPAGVGRRAGGLAAYGMAALIAQDAALLVVILLANGHGSKAAVVLYNYGWQVFEAAYAVLAISIAVSAFPLLSAREGEEFDQTAAESVRAVVLMSFLGVATIFAIAMPAAHFFAIRSQAQAHQLALGLVLFAPGLVGYGLVAALSRVLLASRRNRLAAAAVAGGWLVVIVADVLLVLAAPARWVVGMLGLGNTIGLTVAGVALLAAVYRVRGSDALRGVRGAAIMGAVAAVVASAVGVAVAFFLPTGGTLAEGGVAVLAGCCAVAAFTAVAYALDRGEFRAAVGRARRAVLR